MDYVDQLLQAMRCGIETGTTPDCSKCPYELLAKLPDGFPATRADVVVDGKSYFRCCDTDQITKEAISLIESWRETHG